MIFENIRDKYWKGSLIVAFLCFACLFPRFAMAQTATASVNGAVEDQTGAVIPSAQVKLTNVGTNVTRTTATNSQGIYAFPNVTPGIYSMRVSAHGFASVVQPPVTLQVDQIGQFDFHLKIGTTKSTVTVTGAPALLDTSTSQLGTVITGNEVKNLPLNGRNFTELLTITPGVSSINTGQNGNGGGGWNGHTIGPTTIPSINGASTRSDMFMLDGANDLNTLSTAYNFAPIIDAIQEFKVQDHNDLAQYGGVGGGTITLVTKSGTNHYHGALWEFLRNEQMDSRGYFEAKRAPLRQNQYGASIGGPISIPKLYNGKNRTFFYVAWEGYRYASTQETGTLGPTNAMRNGDFSALGVPIYDPTTTVLDTATGQYTRETFTQEYNEGPGNTADCGGDINCIPASRINPISALYESIIPTAGPLVNGSNIYVPGSSMTNQNSGTIRVDENLNNNNQIMFRYSQYAQDGVTPSGTIGQGIDRQDGHNWIGHFTHTFSPTTFADVYFGRNSGLSTVGTSHAGENAAFLSQLQKLGMSSYWMTLNNTLYAPEYAADNYVGLTGSQLQSSGIADTWQFGGTFTKIIGKNTFKAGADFETNNFVSPIAYSGAFFGNTQTAGAGTEQGIGGNSWASLLLGVPREGQYRNVDEQVHGGWINGMFIQDQMRATNRLTINGGFRNTMVLTPIYGSGTGGNYYTGEANPLTGQYVLNALPPACSATQGAPCIPVGNFTASSTPAPGGLPAHVTVNPTLRMIHNTMVNWAGRLGLAYRINDKTVVRAGYGRQYDAWATITQLSQNFAGNWPAVGTIDNNNLNTNTVTEGPADPLGLGGSGAVVYPINDFSQVSQWMVDPNFKTPYDDQFNIGVERQLPGNTVIDANYVGSVGRHEDWSVTRNEPQPGPGNVAARRPFPYMLPQWFDQSVGDSRYDALQVTFKKLPSHGVSLLVAYTLAENTDDGCELGGSCNSSDPYNRSIDYGISDLNQKNVFTAAFTAQSPFHISPNKLVSKLAGGWALNGIVTLHSGQPYTVKAGGDPENNGGDLQERMDMIGNPNQGPGIHTRQQWFNVNAFAPPPAYTYGTEKVNPLTSQFYSNIDLSLDRSFHLGMLGKSTSLEFRASAFNLLNEVVFGVPDTTDTDTNYGQVTGVAGGSGPRQLQLALKFYY